MTFHSDDSTYVVKYMNLMGRAGVIRAILHLAGAKYTNEFVTMDEVAANRAAYPFGHVPVLIEHCTDGTTFELGESIAIEHYLAEKFGLLGSTPQQAALCKSIGYNIGQELYPHCFGAAIPFQQAIQDPKSDFNTKTLPQFTACHERWLNKNGNNGHYFGDQLTYPDLVLLNWVRLLDTMGVHFEENSPIKKLERVLKELPAWKGQYEDYHPVKMIDA
ncbi:hypothetical protein BGZ70_008047 [Mortierella alpina]|uniref:GST N-terminal domain-containing protein n=1 Tax=Mortierella alpina TaxID=64518 RepID=A0A9P6JDN3_MORAP|nr:hypothetical protein BGZ70_008047 [Mortierella alpina]